jgi:hypothetical protein
MISDSNAQQFVPHHLDISRLPQIVSLEIRPRRFDPPRRVTRNGVDHLETQATEFTVTLSEPFPARALGPALWVGGQAITTVDSEGLVFHFYAFDADRLAAGAPIMLGWTSPSTAREQTPFRFTAPTQPGP